MAGSGWYPDPSGAPGRFRFWDGSRWSAATTDNPASPPPPSGPVGPPGPVGPKRNRTPLLIGGLALLVVVVLVIVLVVRMVSDRNSAILDPDPPSSSVSGWNDSSPLPTATPTPSQSSSPSSSAEPQGLQACPAGDPLLRQSHPNDGRIYGGDLSFAPPTGYVHDTDYSHGFTWAYDTDGVSVSTEPGWASLMAVGYVKTSDGFKNAKQTVSLMMECVASSGYYSYYSGRTDLFSKQVSVDGHQGWAMRTEIRVHNPNIKATGDVAEIIVVDTGTAGQLSFFGAFVPIGDQPRIAKMDETINTLRVG